MTRKQAFQARRAVTTLEVLVSFTLLGSVLAFSAPLCVAHQRQLRAQRDYRLALDELNSQLDRLAVLPEADLAAALRQPQCSTFIAARLPGATLRGQLAPVEFGQRLTLELTWSESHRQAAPLRMSTWIIPLPAAAEQPE